MCPFQILYRTPRCFLPYRLQESQHIILSALLLVPLINKNDNDFKSRFLEVTVYKNLHIFSLYNKTIISCQGITDPQGPADHSLGNAELEIVLVTNMYYATSSQPVVRRPVQVRGILVTALWKNFRNYE